MIHTSTKFFCMNCAIADDAAARLARELAALLESAILHSSVDDKGADNTLATAKALVEGSKLFVNDIMKIKDSPGDDVPRDALKVGSCIIL